MVAGISRVDRLGSTLHELSRCKQMEPILIEGPTQQEGGIRTLGRMASEFDRSATEISIPGTPRICMCIRQAGIRISTRDTPSKALLFRVLGSTLL